MSRTLDDHPPGQQPPPAPGRDASAGGEDGARGRNSFFGADAEEGQRAAGASSSAGAGTSELARALVEALCFVAPRETPRHPGTSPVEIRQKVEMRSWDGKFQPGQSTGDSFRIFKSSFLSWISSERLEGVLVDEEIPVGANDVNIEQLKMIYGNARVDGSMRVWNQLLWKVTASPIQGIIFAAQSPQRAWFEFQKFQDEGKESEREELEDEWNTLAQGVDEGLMTYVGRAKAIWMKLRSYGDNRQEASMCRHIVRNLRTEFSRFRDMILFSLVPVTSDMMEGTLRQAANELKRAGGSGGGSEATRHALVAPGGGRGNGAGRFSADRRKGPAAGYGVGERGGGEARTPFYCNYHGRNSTHDTGDCVLYCKYHGRNPTHDTIDCMFLRRFLNDHCFEIIDFLEQKRGGGPARGNGRGGDHQSRQQQVHPSNTGESWGRGRAPEPRQGQPLRGGYGPGPGDNGEQYGGRGYEQHRTTGHGGRGRAGYGDGDAGSGAGNNLPPSNSPSGYRPNGHRHAHVAQDLLYSDSEWGSAAVDGATHQHGGLIARGGNSGGNSRNDAVGGTDFGLFADGGELRQRLDDFLAGTSPAGPDAYQQRSFGEYYDSSQQQQQQQQQHLPASSSSTATPSSDSGASAREPRPRSFIARRVHRASPSAAAQQQRQLPLYASRPAQPPPSRDATMPTLGGAPQPSSAIGEPPPLPPSAGHFAQPAPSPGAAVPPLWGAASTTTAPSAAVQQQRYLPQPASRRASAAPLLGTAVLPRGGAASTTAAPMPFNTVEQPPPLPSFSGRRAPTAPSLGAAVSPQGGRAPTTTTPSPSAAVQQLRPLLPATSRPAPPASSPGAAMPPLGEAPSPSAAVQQQRQLLQSASRPAPPGPPSGVAVPPLGGAASTTTAPSAAVRHPRPLPPSASRPASPAPSPGVAMPPLGGAPLPSTAGVQHPRPLPPSASRPASRAPSPNAAVPPRTAEDLLLILLEYCLGPKATRMLLETMQESGELGGDGGQPEGLGAVDESNSVRVPMSFKAGYASADQREVFCF